MAHKGKDANRKAVLEPIWRTLESEGLLTDHISMGDVSYMVFAMLGGRVWN